MSLARRLSIVQPNRSNRGGCCTCQWLDKLPPSDRAAFDAWIDEGRSVTQLWEIASSDPDHPLPISLYDYLRPHIRDHPILFVDGGDKLRLCNRCGHETEPIARRYVANVLTYSMRRCLHCGGYSRISVEPERMSIFRGV